MIIVAYLIATASPSSLLLAGFIVGLAAMRIYDNNWERIWRVPPCRPGHCYCRTTCLCVAMEPQQ